MQAYSIEFRREVLADCDAGMSTMAVAIKHRVSDSWVRRLKQRRRETGEIAARPPKKKTPPKWHAYADRLRSLVQKRSDITLRELREALAVDVSLQTLSVALRALKYSFKKKSCGPQSKTGQTSPRGGRYGESNKRDSTRNDSFSSMKRG
jgi:transposase